MRISLNWLNEYIDLSDIDANELAAKLDLAGTEVENIFEEGLGLDKVTVGLIKKIKPHSNADRLVVCDVYTGVETRQIVCGATNIKEGDKVPVALPGAVLANGLKIKKAVIRGEKSAGMLASEVELGLGENTGGIMILDKDIVPGERLDVALDLVDTILELEITPNRPDLMSMIGIAREIGAILGRDYKINPIKIREESKKTSDIVKVAVKDSELNPRYIAKIIKDVKVAESPYWLKKRLLSAGARPINNLVDITNYVLFETGQPLHVFDYDLLEGSQIITRRARTDEKIETLDDVERVLNNDNLVIADAKRAIALAGVMGGANSEVNEQTKTVLLEAAYFNPLNIGYTSRKLGLISESSMRFERGVDPNNTSYAADRAAQLIQELASGKVLKGCVDVYPKRYKQKKIKLRPKRVNQILGIDIKPKKMVNLLSGLELEVVSTLSRDRLKRNERSRADSSSQAPQNNNCLEVGVPTFRPDLEREIDLIEEIGRLYGLNKIKSTLPRAAKVGKSTELKKLQNRLRNQLAGYGLKEAITYSFIDPNFLKKLDKDKKVLFCLKNPISEEQSVLRPSLLPGLVSSLLFNTARKQENVHLFEMGTIFRPSTGLPKEMSCLGLILSGKWQSANWYRKNADIDFFDAKGLVESIIRDLNIVENLSFESVEERLFHPQKSFDMRLGKEKLGFIGEFHPDFIEDNALVSAVYAELDLALLLKYKEVVVPFQGIPPYPGITLDVALLVDKKIKHQEIVRSIVEMGQDLLADVKLFDIYEGEKIEKDKKSMAYSLTYQSMDRTLELVEVQEIHNSIIENLKKDLKATIR